MKTLLSKSASALAAILVVTMSFTAILTVPPAPSAAHASTAMLA